jgi:hypothetical protein
MSMERNYQYLSGRAPLNLLSIQNGAETYGIRHKIKRNNLFGLKPEIGIWKRGIKEKKRKKQNLSCYITPPGHDGTQGLERKAQRPEGCLHGPRAGCKTQEPEGRGGIMT